jgi:hypothetical protein
LLLLLITSVLLQELSVKTAIVVARKVKAIACLFTLRDVGVMFVDLLFLENNYLADRINISENEAGIAGITALNES